MRLLHIGDFHYRNKSNDFDQNHMIQAFLKSLKEQPKIDFIFFSGDLVNKGSERADFERAFDLIIKPVIADSGIPAENVFLCAGNHDINRNEWSSGTINFFDEKVNTDLEINSMFNSGSKDFELSLAPSANYNHFVKSLPKITNDFVSPLYGVFIRQVDDETIGIVTLNSAWLSSGLRDDNTKLIFPTLAVKDALNRLKMAKAKEKIVMLHHPLSWFKEENGIELEHLINSEFDIKLSGHIHREDMSTRYAGSNGIYSNTTPAGLTYDKTGQIGYSILEFNLNDTGEDGHKKVLVYRSTYNKSERNRYDLPPLIGHC